MRGLRDGCAGPIKSRTIVAGLIAGWPESNQIIAIVCSTLCATLWHAPSSVRFAQPPRFSARECPPPSTKIAWNNPVWTASIVMNLINLDIRMLRSLMSVVETGSITETARRLGRTQPAITLQLQRLEELTGKAMFIHEGRRLFLTAEGETVLTYAQIDPRRCTTNCCRSWPPRTSRATSCSARPTSMPPSCCRRSSSIFRKAFPRVQVELNCSLSTPLVGLRQARRSRYRAGHPHERFHRRPGGAAGAIDLDDRRAIHRA